MFTLKWDLMFASDLNISTNFTLVIFENDLFVVCCCISLLFYDVCKISCHLFAYIVFDTMRKLYINLISVEHFTFHLQQKLKKKKQTF